VRDAEVAGVGTRDWIRTNGRGVRNITAVNVRESFAIVSPFYVFIFFAPIRRRASSYSSCSRVLARASPNKRDRATDSCVIIKRSRVLCIPAKYRARAHTPAVCFAQIAPRTVTIVKTRRTIVNKSVSSF